MQVLSGWGVIAMDLRTTRWRRRLAILAVSALLPLAWPSVSNADVAFACKAVDVNTCTVTIVLSSNMNEQVTMTMTDKNPW